MKKLLYILPLAALFITSCSKENNVSGTLPNADNNGKTVVLFESAGFDQEFKPTDSTTIENNKFTIKRAEAESPSMAYLIIKDMANNNNIPVAIPFVNENGSVEVTIDSVPTLKGTPTNDAYQSFITEMRAIDKEIYILASKGGNNGLNVTDENIAEYQKLNDKMMSTVYDFVKKNIKTPFGEFMLMTYASFMDIDQLKAIVNEANPAFQAKLKPMLEGAGNMDEDPYMNEQKFTGKKYTNLSGENPEGKKIALSDYVGKNKLVLIDFWASWCGPCVQEMPNLVEAYKLYKDKGFEIVGVSLDEEKGNWTAALKKLGMTWPQMSDLKGWKSDLAAVYHVESIPFTLLVNQDGEIIAENLRGDQLVNILAQELK